MKINLNNNSEDIPGDEISVTQLLKFKNFTFKLLIVKINGNIVKRDDYENSLIHNADNVDVIHMISGG